METVSSSNRFKNIMLAALSGADPTTTTIANSRNNSSRPPRPEKDLCLYAIYKKEGDHFCVRRKYKKAVDSYSLALNHKPKDMTVLIARSRSYANMGLLQQALADAEAALDIDSGHALAIHQKAQVLYSLGQYDMALLFFSKGRKLNPNAPAFTEGVEKSQIAISYLTPGNRMKTTVAGDLSMYIPNRPSFSRRYQPIKNIEAPKETEQAPPLSPGFRKRRQLCKLVSLELQKKTPVPMDIRFTPHPPKQEVDQRHVTGGVPDPDQSAMRFVLNQLYTDKAYFEKILRDMENSERFNEEVLHLAGNGLNFVTERMLFWAQFGTPAPTPTGMDCGKDAVAQLDLPKLYETAVNPRERALAQSTMHTSREDTVTSLRNFPKMTSLAGGDDDDDVFGDDDISDANKKCAVGRKSNKRVGVRRRASRSDRKQDSSTRRDKSQGATNTGQRKRKIKRKQRTRKNTTGRKGELEEEEEKEELTSLHGSEAEKLKFQFHTYRGDMDRSARDPLPGVRPLVRTKEELSTDDWDSQYDNSCDDDSGPEGGADVRQANTGPGVTWMEGEDDGEDGDGAEVKGRMQAVDPVMLYLIRTVRDIAREFDNQEYLPARDRAHKVLNNIAEYSSKFMADKMELVATLHSFLGNVYLELSDLDPALKHHSEDLRIGQEMKLDDAISRALGNMGRTHLFRKDYISALQSFARKSHYVKSSMEKAWLYHEIANCFLQLKHYEFAKDAADKALGVAMDAGSSLYQLQASVLLAVSEVKLKKYEQAYDHFSFALDQARLRGDTKAENSIRSALQQVNETMTAELRDKQLHINYGDSRDELSYTNSLAECEHEELIGLKDSDSEKSNARIVMEAAAAALAIGPPSGVRQSSVPSLRSARLRPLTAEDLVQREDKEEEEGDKIKAQNPALSRNKAALDDDEGIDENDYAEDDDNPSYDLRLPPSPDHAGDHGIKDESDDDDDDDVEDEEKEEKEEPPKIDPEVRRLALALKDIEEAMEAEDAESVISKARPVLQTHLEQREEQQEAERDTGDNEKEKLYRPLVAKLHSFIGTAAMMLEDYTEAQLHHEKDLQMGVEENNEEMQSRALENLGRVYVLRENYGKALELYAKRLEMDRDDETSARVFHEIANCMFQVQHYTHARDSARLAVQHAKLSRNTLIMLQSSVLMAVCQVKENELGVAINNFERALGVAVKRDDTEAEEAIEEVLKNLRIRDEEERRGRKRGNRMANKFYPMTDWVSEILHKKLSSVSKFSKKHGGGKPKSDDKIRLL